MPDALPKWADEELSKELSSLRERGEGVDLEFKADFPPQGHDLAAEIAAFANSGGGRILIGIADDGSLSGLPAEDGTVRDKLIQRAQGVVRTVRPDVKASYPLAIEQGKTVLCIQIPKQDEPVYYHDGRPYIRDDRCSRRATPEEVKQMVWMHPSSEHKRFQEQIERLQLQQIVDQSRRSAEQMADQDRRAAENHDNLSRRMTNTLLPGQS